MTLKDLGWNAAFEEQFAPYRSAGWRPGRLVRDNKISYGALLEGGEELEVVMSGKVYHDAETDAELPAVGDWVALDSETPSVIRARLPRQTCLSRKMPGKSTEEQVIAHCKTQMAHFKVPKKVVLLAALPKNPSGKVLKRELRTAYEGTMKDLPAAGV